MISARLRYWFDNVMSRGTPALTGLLGLITLGLVLVIAVLVEIFAPGAVNSPGDAVWKDFLHTLDSGAIGGDPEDQPVYVVLMFLATLGGIFILSALVGVLTTGLSDRLVELRKGRSMVLEKGHVVVLGWSDQLPTIIRELSLADDGTTRVAILADRDKVAMEDELRTRLRDHGKVRIVCRTGNPADPADLAIVRPEEARVLMLPSPAGDNADIQVVKTLLALRQVAWPKGRPPSVAVIRDTTNMPAATLAGGTGVTIIDAEDITARLLVQSRRHPGLSAVCTDLLGFEGVEIHMIAAPSLAGRTYGEALQAYATSAVIGVRHPVDGWTKVNPPADTVIGPDDEMVVLAENSASIRLADSPAPVAEPTISGNGKTKVRADDTLVLGWNDRGPTIVRLLDRYLTEGSTLHIAATRLDADFTVEGVNRLVLTSSQCDPTSRRALEALGPHGFEHVVVLADDNLEPAQADAHSLVTLLHLRDLKERGEASYAIVGELNDDANRRLAQVTRADDFVVSQKMISLLLTQLACNGHLSAVFAELFEPGGSDVYLKPVAEYVLPGTQTTFATVIEAALRRGETAFGYRLDSRTQETPGFGVRLNPPKDEPITFTDADRIVVLAEN
ncbi:CASTOR/POLLUX-related putative ion channel [Hamadaea tsunoensis]|uniref:CASTOR/POLLUX-related putative ion channel n=1 Tax=Hamadaea tsunoensis TaxID=53368 RepID=UPI000425A7EF|nr:hypothetical protein [Hamadaea tsunoensis]